MEIHGSSGAPLTIITIRNNSGFRYKFHATATFDSLHYSTGIKVTLRTETYSKIFPCFTMTFWLLTHAPTPQLPPSNSVSRRRQPRPIAVRDPNVS